VAQLEGSGDHSGIQVSLTPWPKAAGALPVAAALTDATGNWRLDQLAVGTYAIDYVRTPGYAPATGTVTVPAKAAVTALPVILVAIPGVIRGNAFFEGGAAGGFAATTVRIEGSLLSTATLADGSWTIPGVGAGTHAVVFERAGFDSQRAQVVTAPGGDVTLFDVTLAVSRGSLAGTFTLTGAAASAGVVVTATKGTASSSTVTDATGAWSLAGLAVGSWSVTARLDPNWQAVAGISGTVTPGAVTSLATQPLAPLATASISGVALLEGGGDPRTVSVSLNGADFRNQPVALTAHPSTLGGAYTFTGLVAGSYQLAFSQAGYDTPAPLGVSISSGQTASLGALTLAASRGDVTGVADAAGTTNDAGTVVTVSGGPDTASTVTDATGRWRIGGLRVGSGYTATFLRGGYTAASSASFQITAGGLFNLGTTPLAVATSATLSGVAHLQRPVGADGGIGVSLTGSDLNGTAVSLATSTGPTGAWSIGSLPQGIYQVAFSKPYYDGQVASGVAVTAGGSATVSTVTLPVSTGTIAGQATLSRGTAAAFALGADFSGIVVSLTGLDAGVSVPPAFTDAAGNFRFTGVPVSTTHSPYGVVAQASSYTSAAGAVTADPSATAAVAPATLVLSVNVGSVAGNLAANDTGTPAAPASGSITVSLTGTAFNATSLSASVTNVGNSFSLPNLPAGSYDLVATAAGRSCGGIISTTVAAGQAVDLSATLPAYTFTCIDAVAPGVPTLGLAVNATGGSAGYVTTAAASIPVTTGASDASGNFRGYQWVIGPTPSWAAAPTVAATPATPVSLAVSGLALDAANTVWVRAVDLVGNAGPAVSTTVITDTVSPLQARINTPRLWVNDTTTSVALAGGSDVNFDRYERCSFDQAATATCAACACPATGGCSCGSGAAACTFATSDAAFALPIGSVAGKEKTCLYARAVDKAGRAGPLDAKEFVSDLVPPIGPTISPLYDPTAITIHADYADFFVTSPATDLPGSGAPWANVAWVEVNAGSGFTPLCPAAACHPGGVYDPCNATCACTDPRLVCREGSFYAVRVPLLGGTANSIAIRAVDVAGNVGSGAAQDVPVAGLNFQVAATSYDEGQPRVRGRILVYRGKPSVSSAYNSLHLVDLGANQLFDAGDNSCELSGGVSTNSLVSHEPDAEPLGPTAVVWAEMPLISNQVRIRRAGADGLLCTGDDTNAVVKNIATTYPWVAALSASMSASGLRERAAWSEQPNGTSPTVVLKDGGADNLLGTADDVEYSVATVAGNTVHQLQLAGDALLFGSNGASWSSSACADLRVVTPVGGNWAAGVARSWSLPAGALFAALDDGGKALAWFTNGSGTPTLHVVLPGPDGLYGTADDVDRPMSWSGPSVLDGGLAFRGGHVVLTEAVVSSGAASIDHWYAGADGIFGTGDDTFARVLPSAAGRIHPTLGSGLSGGTVYFQAGATRTSGDVLGVDLSALRWEVAGAGTPLAGPQTNHAGTLFYTDSGGQLRARTSAGLETTLTGLSPSTGYAADGALLFVSSGAQVWAYRRGATSGQFFAADSPAPTLVATMTGTAGIQAVGAGRVLARENSLGTYNLYEPNGALTAWSAVTMTGVPAGYSFWFGGAAVSASQAVTGCIAPSTAKQVCVREAGPDGIFGTGDDRLFTLLRPGSLANYTNLIAVATSGHRVALIADGTGGPHLYVVDAGPDGKLSTGGDDVEVDYGLIVDGRPGGIDLSGDMLAWSTDSGTSNGQQIFLADFVQRTQRQLTTHFSPKPSVVVDPSGRAAWLDEVFPTSAIFISAP
jgi:hypothetical protein